MRGGLGQGADTGAPCCCVVPSSPGFLPPLCSCSLPGGLQVHQAEPVPASTSPDLAIAPGESAGGSRSAGEAEVSPRGSTWAGGLPVPAGSAPVHPAAELLGDPHVVSFQPRTHHPIPEAPLWACPSHPPLTQLRDDGMWARTCHARYCPGPLTSLTVQGSLA